MTELDKTLTERGKTHGDWEEQSRLSQALKKTMRNHEDGWNALNPMQRDALDMIAVKISRIVVGDPNNIDSWLDVEGYARITRERIKPALKRFVE